MASTTVYGWGLTAHIQVNLVPEEADRVAKVLGDSADMSPTIAWLRSELIEFARSGKALPDELPAPAVQEEP